MAGPAASALVMVGAAGYPQALVDQWRRMPLDASTPAGEAVVSERPVYIGSEGEGRRRYPGLFAAPAPRRVERAWAALPLFAGGDALGAVTLGYAEPQQFADDERSFLETVASQCSLALERARLYESALRERERLTVLLDRLPAGVLIGEAASGQLSLGNAEAERIWRRPFRADARIGANDPYRGFHPEDGRPYRTEEWPLDRAIRSGAEVTGEEIDIERGDGSRGTITVNAAPIRDADGTITAGVATFLDVTERAEARRRMEELYQAELRARAAAERAWRRLERLQQVTAALSQAVTPRQVAEVVVGGGLSTFDIHAAWLGLVDDAGQHLVRLASSVPGEAGSLAAAMPLTAPDPVAVAARRGQATWLDSAAEAAAGYLVLSRLRSADGGVLCAVPLLLRGRPIGALALAFAGAHGFEPEDRTLVSTLAEQCAQALERARLHERERNVARTLQHSMLPAALPEVGSVELAACYRPAEEALEVGGDWYDVVPLPGGRVGLAVGDVAGRGLGAATTMGQLRSALAALAVATDGPGQVLDQLERFALQLDAAQLATVGYGVLELASGRFRYACAGHPPPLLIGADGRPAFLDGGRSPLLCATTGLTRPEAEVVLPPGGLLMLYSDGLVERRGESLDAGLARLADRGARAASVRGSAARLCDGLVDAMLEDLGGAVDDDVAALCLRYCPPFEHRVPALPGQLASLRQDLRSWLQRTGASAAELADLVLACGEAAANAVEHAYRDGATGDMIVMARCSGGSVELEIRDFGRWQPRPAPGDRGRGLRLMRSLADTVEITPGTAGSVVLVRRRLHRAEAR